MGTPLRAEEGIAELLTIGAFARASRLSPKALRLYDSLGLLAPAGDALPAPADGWQHGDVDYVLAQVNVARLREPLDSPLLADFVAALEPVNATADAAPGFIWRLQGDDGDATSVRAFEWDIGGSAGLLVNMSVWESVEALAVFVYSGAHRQVLRRRRRWFERMAEAYTALWWMPRGHLPMTEEAEDRVLRLRESGPTPYAFTLREHFPPPDVASSGPVSSPEEWTCPA